MVEKTFSIAQSRPGRPEKPYPGNERHQEQEFRLKGSPRQQDAGCRQEAHIAENCGRYQKGTEKNPIFHRLQKSQ